MMRFIFLKSKSFRFTFHLQMHSITCFHIADNIYIAVHTGISYFILVFLGVLLRVSRAL